MKNMDAEITPESKLIFEWAIESVNVKVSHYYSKNGLFNTNMFKDSISQRGKGWIFEVNVHYHNSKVENRIKDLTTGARTSLLYAIHLFPNAIDESLCPTVLKD